MLYKLRALLLLYFVGINNIGTWLPWPFIRRFSCIYSISTVRHGLHTTPNRTRSNGEDATLSRIELRRFLGSHAQSDSKDDRAILIGILVEGVLLHNEQGITS